MLVYIIPMIMYCVYVHLSSVLKFSSLMFYPSIIHMLMDIHDMGSSKLYNKFDSSYVSYCDIYFYSYVSVNRIIAVFI